MKIYDHSAQASDMNCEKRNTVFLIVFNEPKINVGSWPEVARFHSIAITVLQLPIEIVFSIVRKKKNTLKLYNINMRTNETLQGFFI